MKHFSQAGDTLIEVAFALTIIAVVMTVTYNISNKAYSLGRQARERTAATNLIQEQAEALRSYRDANTWSGFQSATSVIGHCLARDASCPTGKFYMLGTPGSGWAPQVNTSSPVTSGLYTLFITAAATSDTNKLQFDIYGTWNSAGSPGDASCPLGGGVRCDWNKITTYLVNIDNINPAP